MAASPRERHSIPKSRKQVLLKELGQIAGLLAEENLEFLKHQAEVLLHTARMAPLQTRMDDPPTKTLNKQEPMEL